MTKDLAKIKTVIEMEIAQAKGRIEYHGLTKEGIEFNKGIINVCNTLLHDIKVVKTLPSSLV